MPSPGPTAGRRRGAPARGRGAVQPVQPEARAGSAAGPRPAPRTQHPRIRPRPRGRPEAAGRASPLPGTPTQNVLPVVILPVTLLSARAGERHRAEPPGLRTPTLSPAPETRGPPPLLPPRRTSRVAAARGRVGPGAWEEEEAPKSGGESRRPLSTPRALRREETEAQESPPPQAPQPPEPWSLGGAQPPCPPPSLP